MKKTYIGDSVYVEFDGNSLVLTTENGGPPSNTIYLEPEVWYALESYVKFIKTAKLEDKKNEIPR